MMLSINLLVGSLLASSISAHKLKIISPQPGAQLVPGTDLKITLQVSGSLTLNRQVVWAFGLNCNATANGGNVDSLGKILLDIFNSPTSQMMAGSGSQGLAGSVQSSMNGSMSQKMDVSQSSSQTGSSASASAKMSMSQQMSLNMSISTDQSNSGSTTQGDGDQTHQISHTVKIPSQATFVEGISASYSLVVSQYVFVGVQNTPDCALVSVPVQVGPKTSGTGSGTPCDGTTPCPGAPAGIPSSCVGDETSPCPKSSVGSDPSGNPNGSDKEDPTWVEPPPSRSNSSSGAGGEVTKKSAQDGGSAPPTKTGAQGGESAPQPKTGGQDGGSVPQTKAPPPVDQGPSPNPQDGQHNSTVGPSVFTPPTTNEQGGGDTTSGASSVGIAIGSTLLTTMMIPILYFL